MKSNSNDRPPILQDLGNGSWHYNYDITEVDVQPEPMAEQEGEQAPAARKAYDYDTDELYSEKAHQLEYGMQIGPSVTINPVHHLKVSAYFRVTPSYSMMYLNDEFYHHYATFCNTGFAVAWKVLSVGCEWRWGKASYDGLGLNLDDLEGDYSDGDFSGDIPSADDVLTDLQDLKLKTKSFRVYFSFRF